MTPKFDIFTITNESEITNILKNSILRSESGPSMPFSRTKIPAKNGDVNTFIIVITSSNGVQIVSNEIWYSPDKKTIVIWDR
jgi:hypothetical protein